MKKCMNCGKENEEQASFCISCGTKLEEKPSEFFCGNCGTKMEAGALFCPNCGQKQTQSQVNTTQEKPIIGAVQKPEDNKIGKKGIKPAVIAISVVAAMVAVVLAFGMIRIHGFKNYVASFQKECREYPSMGVYADDYDVQINEAKSIIDGWKFWKTGKQKKQMQELGQTIANMNEKVSKYREVYQEAVDKIEGSGNYYAGDYEEEYSDSKRACEDALKKFDENGSKKRTDSLAKLVDKIISYNEQEGKDMESELKEIGDDDYSYSCEKYLLSLNAEQVRKAYKDKNYRKEKESYDEYQDWKGKFTTQGTVNDYDQVDVSGIKKINLYVNGNDKNEKWRKDSFLIYEKKSKSDQWTPCSVEKIQQIKGNMSIDLVADISTSMQNQFYDMQNCLTQFARETEDDTSLGLSIISSIYERKLTFTKNKNSIESAINQLECQGSTCLYQSLYSSVLYTASATGSRCVVAFTDGKNEPYDSGYDYYEEDVINIAKTYKIPIYIIGIGDEIDEYTLVKIAESTGGAYWNIDYVSDLYDIYEQIYERQKSVYQITYTSGLKSRQNRQVYVYGESSNGTDVIRFQSDIDAEVLADAYADSDDINASDLASYYTKKKYISQYDLDSIQNVNDIQTIINIYYAKNGYKFGNKDVLETMKSLGVISKNGTSSMDATVKKMRKNEKLFKNLMALYNYRYELFYNIGIDVYYNEGYTDYAAFEEEVNYRVGESGSSSRYRSLIKTIYHKVSGE